MPIITFEAAHLSAADKDALIYELTTKASEITHIPESSFTVLIKEYPVDNWGIGGKSLKDILAERDS